MIDTVADSAAAAGGVFSSKFAANAKKMEPRRCQVIFRKLAKLEGQRCDGEGLEASADVQTLSAGASADSNDDTFALHKQ